MDALGFVAKLHDEVILERSWSQRTVLFDSVAISARVRSRGSEDEIAMRVWRLIGHDQLRRDYQIERIQSCQKHYAHHQMFADIKHL
jgi:hypothetical protein